MNPDGSSGDGEPTRRIELEEIGPLTLDEALSIVGEKTRARILIELGRARTTDPGTPNAVGFSELMNAVGVDDSGRFNYHLDKLVGTFIKKAEDGYSLRLPGQLVYEAVIGGTLMDRRTIEPFAVGPCPECDEQLTAAYHPDHLLTVECTGCGRLFDAMHFPARGLEGRSRTELLDAAFQRRHGKIATMRRGVCRSCGGVVEREITPSASISYGSGSVEEMAGLESYAVLACTGCNTSLVGHPTNVAITTPVVTGFFADHGRDVALARWWRRPIGAARASIDVVQTDPRWVSMSFEIDDDRLQIVLDDELQAVASERTSGVGRETG